MNYKQTWLTGAIIAILSLFAQTLNWVAYEKLGYSVVFTFITPLILCFMYHLVQLDAGGKSGFSRRFFFLFSVAVPFAAGLILTLVLLLLNPGISTFNPDADYTGTAQEIISVYAGRYMVTSLYMAIFALIDIPILRHVDAKRSSQ
jgi:hypothetical protein